MEIIPSRSETVGGLGVRRALPTRGRRTVGPWCFADHLGPADVDASREPGVGPHPHIGLATVTWLLDGELLHRDSLGSEQTIRPGQLNLMTAGGGVQHAEQGTGYAGAFEGIQLWVALPDATRRGPAAFEHHGSLPQVELASGVASVLIGEFSGVVSPARADSRMVGVELAFTSDASVALRPDFEYALVVLRGSAAVAGTPIEPGRLASLGSGLDELALEASGDARIMLLGGVPIEPITMFWNFVGRDRAELAQAGHDWNENHDRFGRLDSPLARIPAPRAPWPSGA